MKIIIFIIFILASTVLADSLEQNLEKANKYTVKILNSIDIPFIGDYRGSGKGTGILIDKERGYILSNAHVTGRSPAKNEVNFKEQDTSGLLPLQNLEWSHLEFAVSKYPKEGRCKSVLPQLPLVL